MPVTYHSQLFNGPGDRVVTRAEITPIDSKAFKGLHIVVSPTLRATAYDLLREAGCVVASEVDDSTTILVPSRAAKKLDSGEPYDKDAVDCIESPLGEDHPEDQIAARGINVAGKIMMASVAGR